MKVRGLSGGFIHSLGDERAFAQTIVKTQRPIQEQATQNKAIALTCSDENSMTVLTTDDEIAQKNSCT